MPSILLNRMLAGKVVENHFCNFPHYHNPTPPPPHHHHLPPPPTPHHHHPPPPPPPQDVSGQSGFLESADKCTTASKPTHMIIVHKDVDGDTDDDIDDDNDCITTSKPTHTLIVHDVIDDDDIDHQVHNQPTQLPNSYHPLVSYYVQNAGEEGDVGDDNFNDDEDVDEDNDNDDGARWFG